MANVRTRTRSITKRSFSKDKQSRMEDRLLNTWGWRTAVEEPASQEDHFSDPMNRRLPRGTVLTWKP